MAEVKISMYSEATKASTKRASTGQSGCIPGIAPHNPVHPMMKNSEKVAIHGLRGPAWSAMAPSIGAVSATRMLASAVTSAQIACPSTGSPVMAAVNHGAKMKVITSV